MLDVIKFEQGYCPACGMSWRGKPIPKKWGDMYSSTHYSRVLGIEYEYSHPARYDGVSEYQCPDCKARFGRWTGKQLAEDEWEPRLGVVMKGN